MSLCFCCIENTSYRLLSRLNRENCRYSQKKLWRWDNKISCGRCGAVVRQRCGHGHTSAGPAGVPPREAAGAGPGGRAAQETFGTVRSTEASPGRSQAGNIEGRTGQGQALKNGLEKHFKEKCFMHCINGDHICCYSDINVRLWKAIPVMYWRNFPGGQGLSVCTWPWADDSSSVSNYFCLSFF